MSTMRLVEKLQFVVIIVCVSLFVIKHGTLIKQEEKAIINEQKLLHDVALFENVSQSTVSNHVVIQNTTQRASIQNGTQSNNNAQDIINSSMSNGTTFLWMHIPKTGGTTIYHMFVKKLKALGGIYPDVRREDWHSKECGSHCAWKELQYCLQRQRQQQEKYKPITVIRHPVERVISEFYWWKNQTTNAWTPEMRHVGKSRDNLTAWILHPNNIAHNRQARYFLLDSNKEKSCVAMDGVANLVWTEQHYRSVEAFNKLNASIEEMVKDFEFIALLDDLDASSTVFTRRYGLEVKRIGTSNSSPKKAVTDEQRALILERNRLDLMLYNHIKIDLQNEAKQDTSVTYSNGLIYRITPGKNKTFRSKKYKRL